MNPPSLRNARHLWRCAEFLILCLVFCATVEAADSAPLRAGMIGLDTSHVDGRIHLQEAIPVIKAGKPLFIDKPAAGSLAGAIVIYDLAGKRHVPCFSSSSVRFSPGIQEILKDPKLGKVAGAATWGPCTYQEGTPDMFFYGIHGIEPLFVLMGAGCETVTRIQTKDTDLVAGVWRDGRVGSYRGIRGNKADFGAVAFGTKGIVSTGKEGGYEELCAQTVRFFKSGQPPVRPEETIEIFAFRMPPPKVNPKPSTPTPMSNITRRQFLENSILAAAGVASTTLPVPAKAAGQTTVSANEKIGVAVIGCGIRGKQHVAELARLLDCEILYVCDPDRDRSAQLAADVAARKRPQPKAVQDLRVVLDDHSVAAVFIATPNHWHALAAIWAMQAGKDVYVEKPVSHNIREGRRIVQAARKLGRICQGGTQNRSNGALAEAIRYIHEGKLGKVSLARSIVYGRRDSIGGPGQYEVPHAVDYNLWAGPAPMSPLTRPQFHYDWHWFWNTGNGELGNNNIHSTDVCRWGLGVTGLGSSVISFGGRLGYTDAGETPNTQVVIHDFGSKTIISETRGLKTEPFNPNFKGGWVFYGTEGIIAETSLFDLQGKLVSTFSGQSENHFANFLKAVRSRKIADLNADILEGHQSTALCHIGNISFRLGQSSSITELERVLGQLGGRDTVLETLDRTRRHLADNGIDLERFKLRLGPLLAMAPDHEHFLDSPAADALLTREYRRPFVVPSEDQI
jgi:predicted dehydrogenase